MQFADVYHVTHIHKQPTENISVSHIIKGAFKTYF